MRLQSKDITPGTRVFHTWGTVDKLHSVARGTIVDTRVAPNGVRAFAIAWDEVPLKTYKDLYKLDEYMADGLTDEWDSGIRRLIAEDVDPNPTIHAKIIARAQAQRKYMEDWESVV